MKYNFKCIVAYDGTNYLGWQKTLTGPSIEETLEKAFNQILQEKISLQAASRTDRGVHAEGQVINFFCTKPFLDLDRLKRSVNSLLPSDISILHIEIMDINFHPTLNCLGKEYHYNICNHPVQLPIYRNFSWHIASPLKIEEMQRGKEILTGILDFSAFCNKRSLLKKNSIRQISQINLISYGRDRLRIEIVGNQFLYKMARNIVGNLVYIGLGKLSHAELKEILESKDRKRGGMTAPAHGLFLKQVFY